MAANRPLVTLAWCPLAAAFNGLIWWWRGNEAGIQFLTGYLVEWSLSMDNVFVFAVIFRFFQVPRQYQYPVLFWGILGAVVLRLALHPGRHGADPAARLGSAAVRVFLVYTAYKLARQRGGRGRSGAERGRCGWRGAGCRVADGDSPRHGRRFFVRQDGRWRITPLLLVLLVIESTDLLFAVDSVPAILGISTDAYIVFTSNVFAILGLRALYFLAGRRAGHVLLPELRSGRRAGVRGGENDRPVVVCGERSSLGFPPGCRWR